MTDASPPTTPGTSGTPAAGARASRGASIAVAVLFGLVYSYYLWDAIRSFIELPAQLDAFGYGRENAPWTLLVIGRRRTLGNQAIIFFVGLCAVACLGLGVIALG
jgi:hypothetical protein